MSGNIKEFTIVGLRLRLLLMFLGFIWISCSKPKPEPQIQIKIADSKVYLNDQFISTVDSVTAQKDFLIQSLYNSLISRKEDIKRFRDSVLHELKPSFQAEENAQNDPKHESLTAFADSISVLPFTLTFTPKQKISYITFTKAAYSAFQAEFDRIYFEDTTADDHKSHTYVSSNALQCSPYVFLIGSEKTPYKLITIQELDTIQALDKMDTDTERHVLNQKPLGSLKLVIEMAEKGINVKIEKTIAHNDFLTDEHFLIQSKGNDYSLPNLSDGRDWVGLKKIVEKVIGRLKSSKRNYYCEDVITILSRPESDFSDFRKTISVIEQIPSTDSAHSKAWYRAVVPGLFLND